MRLQLKRSGGPRRPLCGAAAVLLLSAGMTRMASAQPAADVAAVDARTSVYADDDETFISTTTVAARVKPEERVTVTGRYLADVISSASVDVVSAATTRFEETRHEVFGSASYQDGTNTLAAAYVYSVENDWRSHTGNATVGRDFLEHRLTLALSGTLGMNRVGRADDPTFAEELMTASGALTATIVASKDDLVSVTYNALVASGYQASPYRFVRFAGPIAGVPISQQEEMPNRRVRHALGLRYNRHLFRDTALRSHARGYVDDWGVASGTAGSELAIGFGPLEAGPFVRGYLQSAATFYDESYQERRRYMTSDRELGAFADAFGGLRFALFQRWAGPFEALRAEVKAGGFLFRYFDFPMAPTRRGLTADLALGATF